MKENIANYFNQMTLDIEPEEFEKLCLDLLMRTSGFGSLQNAKVEHNRIFKAYDGDYQIDGYIEYFALGVCNKVIVECKMYKRTIERKVVVELYSKVQSLGANKGIIMSTSGFQSGAQEFAKLHGIALIQVVNESLLNVQNSLSGGTMVRKTSRYVPIMYDLECKFPMYPLENNYDKFEEFLNK